MKSTSASFLWASRSEWERKIVYLHILLNCSVSFLPVVSKLHRLCKPVQDQIYGSAINVGILTTVIKGDCWELPAAEELHAEERKDNDEEEEEEDEGDDGLHGVHQRHNQISQRRPIPSEWQNIKSVETFYS